METKFYSHSLSDLSMIPKRPNDSHKGTFGRVLVIGGARGMSGAPYFSAKAAYKTGAGLVQILCHEDNRIILQTLLPEAIVSTYHDDIVGDIADIRRALSAADVIVIGVGLGQNATALQLLKLTLAEADVPLILDADALNLIAGSPEMLESASVPLIVTPHYMEMARLCRVGVDILKKAPADFAVNFAEKYTLVCALKGHETLVVSGDEENESRRSRGTVYLNKSGNSGMATGGSGDALTGVIAGLIAQKMRLFDAVTMGVYLHGLAGDAAAEALGEYSVMTSDIIDHIPDVLKKIE